MGGCLFLAERQNDHAPGAAVRTAGFGRSGRCADFGRYPGRLKQGHPKGCSCGR
jgi:hypothetical protein